LWLDLMSEKKPVMINRPGDLNQRSEVITLPFAREMTVPVVVGNQVVAIVQVQDKRSDYDEADVRQLSLLMDGIWKLTERQLMLIKLHESQARLLAAVENLPFEFWMQDHEGRYILQNQISMKYWGNLIGKRNDQVDLEPTVLDIWNTNNKQAMSGEIVRMELSYPGREALGFFYTQVIPIRDRGEVRGILGINLEINELKQRERELQAMVNTASALRSTSRQEDLIPVVLDQVIDLLQVESAVYFREGPYPGMVQVILGRGHWASRTGTSFSSQGVTHAVLSTGQLYKSDNLKDEYDLGIPFTLGHLTGGVCVPLIAESQTIGGIWAASYRSILENQVHLLVAIADMAANAVHRANLNQQTEQHLQRLTALRSIDLAISSSLDVRVTLNILLTQIRLQLEVDAADVLLYSPFTQSLAFSAGKGDISNRMKVTRLQLGEGLAGQVALERTYKFIPNLQNLDDAMFGALPFVHEGFTSYVALPLVAKGEIKGVLELFHRSQLAPSSDWFEFLQALSSQAAIAIDNAELFDQLQRTNIGLTLAYDATIEGWSRAL
ncbi:MAG: GAF domain-containing protein, partial [Chloroflexota bacterium]